MTDMTLTDMAPFFERYDRRMRAVLATALCVSLVLSAVNFAHGLDTIGAPGAVLSVRWFPILLSPLVTMAWWTFTELMARSRHRTSQPDGRQPASADDARNGARIANGGFVFTLALTVVGLSAQAGLTLAAFGYFGGDLIPRATTVAMGAATIYLGNVWPRMPTPRAPGQKAARVMKINRLWGWLMVIIGMLVVLLGLFLPLLYPVVRSLRP